MTAFDIDALQSTNFEFDIEENRRRRAEIANDVTELINISKFFLEHYSSDSMVDLPPLPSSQQNYTKSLTKREKNDVNLNKTRRRLCSNAPNKNCPVANVTTPYVKRKQMNNRTGQRSVCSSNDDDVPPLFDKVKLHQYCVDIVDRFFHGPPPNGSDFSESPKEKATIKKYTPTERIEKSVQTINTIKSNGIETGTIKPKKNPKYASIPSRYMSQTNKKSMNETPVKRNISPFRLISAKSQEILNEVARKGTEIKRHSCLIHKKSKSLEYKDYNGSQIDNCATHLRFSDIHPSIELIPSNTIFPKRILKQSESSKESSSTQKQCNIPQTVQSKIQSSEIIETNSNVAETVHSSENSAIPNQVSNVQEHVELKLQQLPVLSIKPEPKCGIETVYEIDIKPTEQKSEPLFRNGKNNVFEVVHESLEKEYAKDVEKVTENITPFADVQRVSETVSAENRTSDENHATSNLSLTISTSSHLTDDEKYQSDQKFQPDTESIIITREQKTPARHVIDRILEVENISDSSETPNLPSRNCTEFQPKDPSRFDNFDDLREILQRIRNDKTTLDVALEDVSEPVDFLSPSRFKIDQGVQCDDPSAHIIGNFKSINREKNSAKPLIRCSPQCIDSNVLESPKFNKTIESIRSSARKLDFSINDNEYRAATRQQIEKAAKKFLKSILTNADKNNPQSGSEYEDSSHIHIKTRRQKFHILDDQIIKSNFNIKSDYDECTSSSSGDITSLQLRIPSARLLCNQSTVQCNNWINQHDSEHTTNSIEHYINGYKINGKFSQTQQHFNINQHHSDLSDGEILSDGEFHLP